MCIHFLYLYFCNFSSSMQSADISHVDTGINEILAVRLWRMGVGGFEFKVSATVMLL